MRTTTCKQRDVNKNLYTKIANIFLCIIKHCLSIKQNIIWPTLSFELSSSDFSSFVLLLLLIFIVPFCSFSPSVQCILVCLSSFFSIRSPSSVLPLLHPFHFLYYMFFFSFCSSSSPSVPLLLVFIIRPSFLLFSFSTFSVIIFILLFAIAVICLSLWFN